ncbi:hypothetical protein U3516DRAFT_814789 [Neocallimastix sp. 'constans']
MNEEMSRETLSYSCFICWDDIDFDDNSTKIVSACNCKSPDFKYTHKECLNLWINQNRHSGLKCQVCGTPFHIKRVLKPLKIIYKKSWKAINCLIFGLLLTNISLYMLCYQWEKELEKMNNGNKEGNFDSLSIYNSWLMGFESKENTIWEYIKETKMNRLLQNIYLNATTLFLFINTSILVLFFYHEKDNFFEYSIDEKYEYKNNSNIREYIKKISNPVNSDINSEFSNEEILSDNGSNMNYCYNHSYGHSYQKIVIN